MNRRAESPPSPSITSFDVNGRINGRRGVFSAWRVIGRRARLFPSARMYGHRCYSADAADDQNEYKDFVRRHTSSSQD